ncbi:hypothetical protein cce_3170 [Crocosphaera subtropica ATCC 51142]|uniref:Uncharacterized protein n=1 Tax=Crocosphaera subtropica (strain ATCC 51142 / BH68) TaxID=43989 RepID=B1WXH7_CROS5|nr:hypothetical protein [Crocosphaera subtropica]ACB52518.1 hypothetical protein cce_3170 [Crocosphaera subtropica ATCC 51142]
MSQTPITVTYSLEEILKEINGKLDKIDTRLNNLEVGQARLEEKLTGDIKALDVEVEGINKRLDSQKFINRSVAVGFILAFITGIIKLVFPNLLNFPR